MKNIAQELRSIIAKVEPQLAQMNPDEMGLKPAPDEWSKKEILGHLIDSAANNHQRFVRVVNKASVQFTTYDQTGWVKIQQHNKRPWNSLVALWSAYNYHLCHIIECIPEESQSYACKIGDEDPVPLHFVIKDYLRHLRHHFKDLLEDSG